MLLYLLTDCWTIEQVKMRRRKRVQVTSGFDLAESKEQAHVELEAVIVRQQAACFSAIAGFRWCVTAFQDWSVRVNFYLR